MKGKTIKDTLEFGENYVLLVFDDDTNQLVELVGEEIATDDILDLFPEDEPADTKEEKATTTKKDRNAKKSEPIETTWPELLDMDFEEMEDFCEDNGIKIDGDDHWDKEDEDGSEDSLRKAIAKDQGIKVPRGKGRK